MNDKQLPSMDWIVTDSNIKIRETSINVIFPLTKEDEYQIKRMQAYVFYSQNLKWNKQQIITPAVGIAAPQIGYQKNMYYIRHRYLNKHTNSMKVEEFLMINAVITSKSEQKIALEFGEGCLSVVEKKQGLASRSNNIVVEGYNYLQKKHVSLNIEGYLAIVFQHEQDHLKGMLYYDNFTNDKSTLTLIK